jgi:hypothetical protein
VTFGPKFKDFIDDLGSPEFRKAFERKFSLDLEGRPAMITVRGVLLGEGWKNPYRFKDEDHKPFDLSELELGKHGRPIASAAIGHRSR